jgi:hypothetical protein
VAKDLIKNLELKYQEKKIKFEFKPILSNNSDNREEHELYLNNASDVLLKEIQNILKQEIHKKKSKSIEIHALPGLSKVLDKKNAQFKTDLEILQSKFKYLKIFKKH